MVKKEMPAIGTKGYLIKDFYTNSVYFRVYNEDKTFMDYKLLHNDLEVIITDEFASLYQGTSEDDSKIDYSSKVLGRKSPNEECG